MRVGVFCAKKHQEEDVNEGDIGISWTNEAMNSLYGCTECSNGCEHCYARMRIYRFASNEAANHDGRYGELVETSNKAVVRNGVEKKTKELRFTGRILFNPARLYGCLKSKPGNLIFVDEFSDLLHKAVPMEVILEHFRVFRHAQWLQFQVLTKRSSRLKELDAAVMKEFGEWPANVWMGVSVCTPQKGELNKIAALGKTQAKIKWVSFEPWISDPKNALEKVCPDLKDILANNGIVWSVIGGESGAKKEARLMALEDAEYLFSSSKRAGCRLHFKQLGTKLAVDLGVYGTGNHRSKGGNLDQIPPNLKKRDWPKTILKGKHNLKFKPGFDPKELIKF